MAASHTFRQLGGSCTPAFTDVHNFYFPIPSSVIPQKLNISKREKSSSAFVSPHPGTHFHAQVLVVVSKWLNQRSARYFVTIRFVCRLCILKTERCLSACKRSAGSDIPEIFHTARRQNQKPNSSIW